MQTRKTIQRLHEEGVIIATWGIRGDFAGKSHVTWD